MSDWKWVSTSAALTIHDMQLEEHGGGRGVRDGSLLESALARPRNLAVYGTPDLAELAAAYAFGIAKNHPFVDGNKRTAMVVSETFLDLNGGELEATDAEIVVTFEALAGGQLSEAELAAWFRDHLVDK